MVAAEFLAVEPELEAEVGGTDDDADGVFDAEVVFFKGPEVLVFFNEFGFVGGGEVGVDFAEDVGIWWGFLVGGLLLLRCSREDCKRSWFTCIDSSSRVGMQLPGRFRLCWLGILFSGRHGRRFGRIYALSDCRH